MDYVKNATLSLGFVKSSRDGEACLSECLFLLPAVGGGQEDAAEDAGADRQTPDQSQELQKTSRHRRETFTAAERGPRTQRGRFRLSLTSAGPLNSSQKTEVVQCCVCPIGGAGELPCGALQEGPT